MLRRDWRAYPEQLMYRHPYQDVWGNLHDPTTEWDELLKNCKPWLMLLQVGEGSRRMARPAWSGAKDTQFNEYPRRNEQRITTLEAKDLARSHCRKHWKRRQGRKRLAEDQPARGIGVRGA